MTNNEATEAAAGEADIVARLLDIANNDWRVSFLAHTSDTAKEAATEIASLRERVKGLEGERDDALERVDELEQNAEVISDEFEKDCWKALRRVLELCKFDWRDVEPDGLNADDAFEYIRESIENVEADLERYKARAETAERERDEARAALKLFGEFDHATTSDQPDKCIIVRGRVPSTLTLAHFDAACAITEEK